MKFAKELKRLRKLLKKTQPDFAKQVGIPLNTLRNWEHGRNEPNFFTKLAIIDKGVELKLLNDLVPKV